MNALDAYRAAIECAVQMTTEERCCLMNINFGIDEETGECWCSIQWGSARGNRPGQYIVTENISHLLDIITERWLEVFGPITIMAHTERAEEIANG